MSEHVIRELVTEARGIKDEAEKATRMLNGIRLALIVISLNLSVISISLSILVIDSCLR